MNDIRIISGGGGTILLMLLRTESGGEINGTDVDVDGGHGHGGSVFLWCR